MTEAAIERIESRRRRGNPEDSVSPPLPAKDPELSAWENLLLTAPGAEEKRDAEERLAAQEFGRYDAAQKQRDVKRVLIADAQINLQANERGPTINPKVVKRYNDIIAKESAALREIDAQFEVETAFRPGSLIGVVNDFIRSPASHKRYVDANTTDEALPGKSAPDMVAMYRGIIKQCQADMKATQRAPQDPDAIRATIYATVEREAANMDQALAAVRGVNYSEEYQRFTPRPLDLPKLTVATKFGDGMGLMLALMGPELAEKLCERALAFDHSKALTMTERYDRLATIRAAMIDAAYKGCFWHRECLRIGANPGPRVPVVSALQVLDVVEA